MKKCRYSECGKVVDELGIQTEIGWFCSQECADIVTKRIFEKLVFPNWFKPPEESKDLTPESSPRDLDLEIINHIKEPKTK